MSESKQPHEMKNIDNISHQQPTTATNQNMPLASQETNIPIQPYLQNMVNIQANPIKPPELDPPILNPSFNKKQEELEIPKQDEIANQKKEKSIFLSRKDCLYDRFLLSLSFMVAIAIFLILMYCLDVYGTLYFLIPIIACAIAYIVEAFTSNTFFFIKNTMIFSEAEQLIISYTKSDPKLYWVLQNYHFETRTSSDGKGSVSSYQVRVNTYRAKEDVHYRSCVDSSNMMESLKHLPLLQYCRIYTQKSFNFADPESKTVYDTAKAEFIHKNHKDAFYDFTENMEIAGFLSRICTYGSNNRMPCIYTMAAYALISLIGFSWVIRILLYKNSFAVKTSIIKTLKF